MRFGVLCWAVGITAVAARGQPQTQPSIPPDSPLLLQIKSEEVTSGAFNSPTTQPSTNPTDPTVDWLLGQATTAPSVPDQIPTTGPVALKGGDSGLGDVRAAVMVLSNGDKITGNFSTTLDQPIRVWDDTRKEYRDVPYSMIKSIEAHVDWERDEKDWNFKESGSDIKIYSGKTYPTRMTSYTVTLTNGDSVTGAVTAPLYLNQPDGTQKIYILHKRDKGEVGQKLTDLVFVQSVQFSEH